jgi:hypothetical protein
MKRKVMTAYKNIHHTIKWARTAVLSLCATLGILSTPTDGQITDTAFKRVLEIEVGDHSGTAFTIEVDGRQYLVTAKHLVASLKANDVINVRTDDGWKELKVKVYPYEDPIDVAVLIADFQVTASSVSVELTTAGVRFGQEALFLGFPYDQFYAPGGEYNDHHPAPFIKRATMSSIVPEGTGSVLYLDGYNNPGFSGGPIVYRDLSRNDFVFKVAGVVTGFFPELRPVMNPVEIKPNEDLKDVDPWRIITVGGKKYRLEDTKQKVSTNTGIIKGYNISFALELIKKHPDGPKVALPSPQP